MEILFPKFTILFLIYKHLNLKKNQQKFETLREEHFVQAEL